MRATRRTPPEVLRRALELPALDETRCTGIGLCVEACPTRCLEMAGAYPWLARPADCASCGVCAGVCPAGAITMMRPEEAE